MIHTAVPLNPCPFKIMFIVFQAGKAMDYSRKAF